MSKLDRIILVMGLTSLIMLACALVSTSSAQSRNKYMELGDRYFNKASQCLEGSSAMQSFATMALAAYTAAGR